MWISFDSDPKHKFAIRLFVGGINSISGEEFTPNEIPLGSNSEQDYIVIPEQQRLDGIAVRPGVVRQFVATRMRAGASIKKAELSEVCPNSKLKMSETPKGRTVEWQMTGRDDIGGVQMQIIPQFETSRIFAGTVRNTCPSSRHSEMESYQPVENSAEILNVLRTPEELAMAEGSMIHIKDMKQRENNRDKILRDLLSEAPEKDETSPPSILDLEALWRPEDDIIVWLNVEVGIKLFAFTVCIPNAYQKTFQDDGNFQVWVRIANGSETQFAVRSWEELLFLTQPVPIEFQFRSLRELYANLHAQSIEPLKFYLSMVSIGINQKSNIHSDSFRGHTSLGCNGYAMSLSQKIVPNGSPASTILLFYN
ncbi:polyubiquitin [Penicillium herquei]|nr:polyubiquitin [Penicillium herquei]